MNSESPKFSFLLPIAVIAGLVQVVTGIVMYVAGFYFSPWSMLVSVVVLLLCIVVGVRLYRNRSAGSAFGYGKAFLAGAVISVATGVIYAVYNLISINFFYPNFLDEVARVYSAAGAEPVESVRANLSAPMIAIPNLIRLSVIGIILSAIAALFLKRRT